MNESLNEYPVSVRELLQSDIELIANYWLGADKLFLTKMGVDTTKIPSRDEWIKMLTEQLDQINSEKKSYCIDEAKFNEMKRFEVFHDDLIINCSGTMRKIAIAFY